MEMRIVHPDTGESLALTRTEDLSTDLAIHYSSQCKHPETQLCQTETKDGRTQYRKQCNICGVLCGSAQKQTKPSEEIPNFDLKLQEIYGKKQKEEYNDILRKHICLQRDQDTEWWRNYNEYLKSDAWTEKRKLVLERAQGICEGCFKRQAREVHHKTYRNVRNEFLFELVALCVDCHKRLHTQMNPRE